jgi:hypothetical protein
MFEPISIIRLRHLVVLVSCYVSMGPTSAQTLIDGSPILVTQEERAFSESVARQIHTTLPEGKSFYLEVTKPRAPAFPGDQINAFNQVDCEKLASYEIYGDASQLGQISVAVCNDGIRVRSLAERAPGSLSAVLKQLPVNAADARKMGWYYSHNILVDGSTFYYFPVIAMGHGVLAAYTAALISKSSRRSVVIQISTYPLCERHTYKTFPLCANTEGTLKKLVSGIDRMVAAKR